MFAKNEFGHVQGGGAASLWLANGFSKDDGTHPRGDWAGRFRDWAEEVNLVPDLGQNVGSLDWFRGVLTCALLCALTLALAPGFQPLPGVTPPLLGEAQFDEYRSQMILPLALGADSGRRMGPTDAVSPLAETPERPQIQLSAQIGAGDSFARALSRAGVGGNDASRIIGLLGSDIQPGKLSPGTRLDITLGRRAKRNMPRPLEKLAFRARLDMAVEVNRLDGVLGLKRIPIHVDETPLRIQGVVGDGVYRSARGAGAPPKAIQSWLRVIAQQLSLDNIHAGDRYDIIVGYRRAETGEAEVGDLLYAGLKRARGKDIDMLKWTSNGRSEWYEASGVGERRGVLAMPVNGRISSGFGMRYHPILRYTRMHAGIDFAAAYGSPIYAASDGRVVYAGRHGGHGNYVRIDHGGGLATGYAHMSRIAARAGSYVRRGQVIGYVGSSGLSTGPHLHYELYRNGATVNPMSVKFTTTSQLAGRDLAAFRARLAQLKGLKAGPLQQLTHRQTAEAGASAAAGPVIAVRSK